jgi:hypothetical protein
METVGEAKRTVECDERNLKHQRVSLHSEPMGKLLSRPQNLKCQELLLGTFSSTSRF